MRYHPTTRSAVRFFSIVAGVVCAAPSLSAADAAATNAAATNVAPKKTWLDTVTVTAHRRPFTLGTTSSDVAVLTPRDGDSRITDMLARTAGANPRAQGAPGALESISVRGLGSTRTLVLVNGFSLVDADMGTIDLAYFPPSFFDRAELLRGPSSALYAGNGAAGALDLSVGARPGGRPLSFAMEGGSFGAFRATGTWAYGSGANGGRLALSFDRADNRYPYAVGGATRERANADWTRASAIATGRLGASGGDAGWDYLAFAVRNEVGVPGSLVYPSDNRQRDDLVNVQLRTAQPFAGGSARLAVGTAHHALRTTWGTGAASSNTYDYKRRWAGHALFETPRGGAVSLQGGLDLAHDAVKWNALDKANTDVGLVGDVALAAAEGVRVTASGRYDWNDAQPDAGAARLGLVVEPARGWVFKGNLSTVTRVPNFSDLYWPEDAGGTTGNPALTPERGFYGDAGLSLAAGAFDGRLGFFAYDVRDMIVWAYNATTFKSAPVNSARVRGAGIEAEGTVRLEPMAISLAWAYTATDTGSGATPLRLQYAPVHRLTLSARGVFGAFTAGVEATALDERFADVANTVRLPAIGTVTVDAGYVFDDALRAWVRFENLLDARYSQVNGYPVPGFSFRAGIQVGL